MERLLVPYDGSADAECALAAALETPHDELLLVNVVEVNAALAGTPGASGEQYRQSCENATEMLEAVAADHETVTGEATVGRPARRILAVADEHDVDQILMGSRGRDGAARLLLGSVAETVVRRSPVPVTVVREDSPVDPEHALVPFDDSKQARRALALALERSASVTALYVSNPSASLGRRLRARSQRGEQLEEWTEQRDERAKAVLDSAEELADGHDETIETAHASGEPTNAILEAIEAHDVDRVVLGTRGRDGLGRFLLGSVAERVVRRSPTSVTVVS